MSSAKDEILNRIRKAVGPSSSAPDYSSVPRQYRHSGTLDSDGRVDLFCDRLRDYDVVVYRCCEHDVPKAICDAACARGKHSLLVPNGFPRRDLPDSLHFPTGDGLTYAELDRSEGVLTGCALAIATTGTIVLCHRNMEAQRALTLIPDYHLCLVYADQILETVVEGVRAMASLGKAPLTTISGPSATSDIEMTRIRGVHGPRFLDVIVVCPDEDNH